LIGEALLRLGESQVAVVDQRGRKLLKMVEIVLMAIAQTSTELL